MGLTIACLPIKQTKKTPKNQTKQDKIKQEKNYEVMN